MITIPSNQILVVGGALKNAIVALSCEFPDGDEKLICPNVRLIGEGDSFNFEVESFGYRALAQQKLDFLALWEIARCGVIPCTREIAEDYIASPITGITEYLLFKIGRVQFRVWEEKSNHSRFSVSGCLWLTKLKLRLRFDTHSEDEFAFRSYFVLR